MYVVNNVMKSIVLGIDVLSMSWWTYQYNVYWLGKFSSMTPIHVLLMKKVAAIYASTDLASLIVVDKLPMSTKVHHYASTILGLLIFSSRFDNNVTTVHMILLYGFFATLAYSTNWFLGMRVMYRSNLGMRCAAAVAFVVYAGSCAGNWSYHAVWFAYCIYQKNVSLFMLIYIAMMILLINDDVKLILWLFRYASSPANDLGFEEKRNIKDAKKRQDSTSDEIDNIVNLVGSGDAVVNAVGKDYSVSSSKKGGNGSSSKKLPDNNGSIGGSRYPLRNRNQTVVR